MIFRKLIPFLLLSLTACGHKSAQNQTGPTTELEGSWLQGCQSIALAAFASRATIQFTGNQAKATFNFYVGTILCEQFVANNGSVTTTPLKPDAAAVATWSFTLPGGTVTTPSGAKILKTVFESFDVTPFTQAGADFLNGKKGLAPAFCGQTNYQVNQTTGLFGLPCNPVNTLGETSYNIYEIDSSKSPPQLTLGDTKATAGLDGSSLDKLPTKFSDPFVKQ